jgi:2-keto-3-deoxy-L-fuconate dehydrogenase
MSGRLERKTALLTAAADGIGRATALSFAAAGCVVWATDINDGGLSTLKAQCDGIQTRHLDVRDPLAVEDVVKEIGTIDILFNCAGYVHHGTILDCTDQDWDFSFDVNVKSMYRTCRAVLPAMIRAGRGSIINIASIVSSIKGVPNRFVYGTTKAAIIGLTKAIAADHIKSGIRCNAICPGTVDSPSLAKRIAAQGNPEKVRDDFIARQPMGRLGRPEEIAALAVYLASDESSFTTGQVHVIDGGFAL